MRRLLSLLLLAACVPTAAQAPHPERRYLSGRGTDDPVIWQFRCSAGQNSGRWRPIEVPCNWELQGFGDYTYGRWYTTEGAVPSAEEGIYRHTFTVPDGWRGLRVKIFFDGAMTDTEVRINGRPAGDVHRGGFYRFSYDITPLLRFGRTNSLEVRVAKHSADKSVNAAERKADWWLYGGIYRPVWLEAVPQTHVRHCLFDASCDGRLRLLAQIEGDPRGHALRLSLRALADGAPVATASGETSVTASAEGSETLLESLWTGIRPWTPESPCLYTARLELLDPAGRSVQQRDTRIGFRTVEFVPQDGIYLNGRKLLMKGINRHSFSVGGGRTTSPALSRQDAELIRSMNINAVRSHYPPDEHFLDMCDSLGLLYVDELAGWHDAYAAPVGRQLVRETVERDANHPCIVLWSNGNEGGWNPRLDTLFARHDRLQRRHVIHPWADFGGIDTHHYPAYLTGVGRFTNGRKVFMPTEFMHAMYDQGGGAGLRDFWERWLSSPCFAGGFIWAFCDEAPMRTDRGGALDSDGSNAPDGVVGPRREKEGSFYAIRAQWSPVRIVPFHVTERFDGSFRVSNEYLFTDLSQCRMTYAVRTCPSPLRGADTVGSVIAAGEVRLPSASPGETRTARMALPENFRDGDLLELEAFGPDGRSVCTWSYPIRPARAYFEREKEQAAPADRSQPEALRTADAVMLRNNRTEVTFDPATGMIRSIRSHGRRIPLSDGPAAVGMKMVCQPERSTVRTAPDGAVYCARYRGAADSIVWRLTPDGLLEMKALLLNRASGGGGFDDGFTDSEVYSLGLTFSYPESACTGMRWLGHGPYRVWKNRIEGTRCGIWHKAYNDTVTGESYDALEYPEFKGYHAELCWATIEGEPAPWSVHALSDGIFLRLFTPREPLGGTGSTMPPFPAGDLSFLLEIPAIRSFKPIEQQGPNSQPGSIRIKKGDEGLHIDLVFDFRQRAFNE